MQKIISALLVLLVVGAGSLYRFVLPASQAPALSRPRSKWEL